MVSLKQKLALMEQLADEEGCAVVLPRHRAMAEKILSTTVDTKPGETDAVQSPLVEYKKKSLKLFDRSCDRGLGLPRSRHKPIPRKFSLEEAQVIRTQHKQWGVGVRMLAKIWGSSPGNIHHVVSCRGAYKHDP